MQSKEVNLFARNKTVDSGVQNRLKTPGMALFGQGPPFFPFVIKRYENHKW